MNHLGEAGMKSIKSSSRGRKYKTDKARGGKGETSLSCLSSLFLPWINHKTDSQGTQGREAEEGTTINLD